MIDDCCHKVLHFFFPVPLVVPLLPFLSPFSKVLGEGGSSSSSSSSSSLAWVGGIIGSVNKKVLMRNVERREKGS